MKYLLTVLIAIMTLHASSMDKALDFWDEEIRLFGVADAGKHVDSDLHERIAISYVSPSFAMDHSTKKEGDFSVSYVPGQSGHPLVFGFVSNLWLEVGNAWSLFHTPIYCRFYYHFSNRNGKHPGRMTPETEKLLLETLWDRTAAKNDIAWARQSSWYLDGSENHDLNAKACNLVSSRIFMNEPDYTLGTQMDHPSAVHSHLSTVGRWHGMTFAQSAKARIVPVCLPGIANEKGQTNPYELEAMYQTVQHEQTLIVQQSRRWYAVHPEWYLINADYNQPIGIWFGKEWDQHIESRGWIFVRRGNAYAAVRPVYWDEKYEREKKIKTAGTQAIFNAPDDSPTVKLRNDCYKWNTDSTIILLEDKHIPVIIEAGRVADYPTIGGEAVNYSYPMTFDSPFLKSAYKSGIIEIKFGDEKLNLNFN